MRSLAQWRMAVLLVSPVAVAGSLQAAASVPAVTLGDACPHVAQLEIAAGAQPKYDVQRMLYNKFLLFDVSRSGQSRETLYQCSDDRTVRSYSERISTRSAGLARSVYDSTKAQLRSRLGAPQMDSEAESLPRRIVLWRAFSRVFSTHESANWTGAHEYASVMLQRAREGSDWQVITLHQVPAAASRSASITSYPVAAVATVALWSATVVGALCLTALRRFRTLLAVATPLALSLELSWSAPIAGSTLNGAVAPPPPGDIVLVMCFVTGALVSALTAWATRRYGSTAPSPTAPSPTMPPEPVSTSGRPAVVLGLALLGACFVWTWWLFRPSEDPASLLGGAGLFLIAPLSLLLATALMLMGTTRLVRQPPPSDPRAATAALAVCGVLGAITSLTLCLNLAAQVVLQL